MGNKQKKDINFRTFRQNTLLLSQAQLPFRHHSSLPCYHHRWHSVVPSARQKAMQGASCGLYVEVSVWNSFLLSHFLWDSSGLPSSGDIHSAMQPLIFLLPLLCHSNSLLLSLFASSLHLPSSSLFHILPILECVFPGPQQACLMGSLLSCGGSLRAAYVQRGASPGFFSQGPSSTKTSTLAPEYKPQDTFWTPR